MILLYMENKNLMAKIITYLDNTKLNYTTDINEEYEFILVADLKQKTIDFIKEKFKLNKKIIFITYLEEDKIYNSFKKNNKNSKIYLKKLYSVLRICYKIITSLPYFKKELSVNIKKTIEIIPREIPIINISKNNKDIYNKYNINKRKKKILLIDLNYKYINECYDLATLYPKYEFIYLGFEPDYNLPLKLKNLLHNIPKNVKKIRNHDLNIYSDLCKISYLVINFNSDIDINYLYTTMLFKRQLLMIEDNIYDDYFINSKNIYLFDNKDELFLKIKKITSERLANLTDNGYELIRNNNYYELSKLYNLYLR